MGKNRLISLFGRIETSKMTNEVQRKEFSRLKIDPIIQFQHSKSGKTCQHWGKKHQVTSHAQKSGSRSRSRSISSFPPGSVSHSPCSTRCSNPVPRRAGRVFRSLIESNPVKISHPGERGEKRQELTPSERARRSHFRGKPC